MNKSTLKEFVKKLIMKEFEDIVYPMDPTADITSEEESEYLDSSNAEASWTMGNGDRIDLFSDRVVRTTEDGEKYYMDRYEWEHLGDDSGDIENGPSVRVPNWIKMK